MLLLLLLVVLLLLLLLLFILLPLLLMLVLLRLSLVKGLEGVLRGSKGHRVALAILLAEGMSGMVVIGVHSLTGSRSLLFKGVDVEVWWGTR